MSTISTAAGFTLLDLLTDEDPTSGLETRLTETEHEQALRETVQMDIGNLLNSRHWLGTWPAELETLKFSILNYGLPDLSGVIIDSKPVQTVLVQTTRMVLEVFEPRLTNIKVVLSPALLERAAQLHITADVRGVSEPLGFRNSLQRGSSATAKDGSA